MSYKLICHGAKITWFSHFLGKYLAISIVKIYEIPICSINK